MSHPYPYESLRAPSASGSYIRLLTLLPAESDVDPIRGKLDIVALTDRPIYEALSYCWGPSNPQYSIDCNGISLSIGPSLHSALWHLRHADKDRKLWVDAVCINQDDLSEKKDQVLLMRDIYKGAQRVLVWLGPVASGNSLAFDTLRRLNGYWAEISERWAVDKLSVLKLGSFRDTLRQLFGTDAGQHKDIEHDRRFDLQPDEIEALRDVLECPWWRRTWVIQEVCLAEDVAMVYGRGTLSWEELSRGYLMAIGPGGLLTTIGATEEIECCQRMYQLKTMFQEMQQQEKSEGLLSTGENSPQHTAIDMLTLIQTSNKFGTTRLHDRIYGVLGLAPAETGRSIVPDYTIPVKECFQNAAISIITNTGNLDVFMDPAYRLKEGVDLPSWAPHWGYDAFESSENKAWGSATPFTPHISIAILADLFRQQDAGLSACGENSRCEPRIVDNSILVLEGYIADSVATIGPALDGKLDDDSEEKWAQYANQYTGVSLMAIPRIIIQVLVRIATFPRCLLGWEELAFAEPASPTQAEQESYMRVLLSNRMFQNVDISLAIYQRDWSPLLKWARWLSPLKALGARQGASTIYNVVVGALTLVMAAVSSTKSHLVTIGQAMESRLARTDAGRLARLPSAARVGDRIALLKGSKMPVLVRPMKNGWEFVGCCYVDGIMYGEGWHVDSVQKMEFI